METSQDATEAAPLPQHQSPGVALLKSNWANIILLVLALLSAIFVVVLLAYQGKAPQAVQGLATAILLIGYTVGVIRSIFRFRSGGGASLGDFQRQAQQDIKRRNAEMRESGSVGIDMSSSTITGFGNFIFARLFTFFVNVVIWPFRETFWEIRYLYARWSVLKKS